MDDCFGGLYDGNSPECQSCCEKKSCKRIFHWFCSRKKKNAPKRKMGLAPHEVASKRVFFASLSELSGVTIVHGSTETHLHYRGFKVATTNAEFVTITFPVETRIGANSHDEFREAIKCACSAVDKEIERRAELQKNGIDYSTIYRKTSKRTRR